MDDLGYGLAWRVLDAQFFGVAQRRRRVFLVGSLGNQRAAEILFEPDCLRWDHPSSREKRQELTRAAQQRAAEGGGDGRVAYGMAYKAGAKAQAYPISEELHPTLSANRHDASVFTAPTYCIDGSIARGARFSQNGKGWSDTGECYTLNTIDIPAVAAPSVLAFNTTCITSPTNGNRPQWGDPCHCLAAQDHPPAIVMASGQANAEIEVDMAPAQSARQYKDLQIVCMADDNANAAVDVDLCGSLKVGGGRPCIAYRATETTSSAHSAPATSRESETSTSARGR
jgi:DNA (cytosine-5)-methyltransferase 1